MMAAISLKFIGVISWADNKRLRHRMKALPLVFEQGFAVLNF